MINAEFYLKNDVFIGFSVKGHAGYKDFGFDICCASVTSAVQLTANAITEILKVSASVGAFENEIKLTLLDINCKSAIAFIQALRLQLELLANDYEGHIRVSDTEL